MASLKKMALRFIILLVMLPIVFAELDISIEKVNCVGSFVEILSFTKYVKE